MKNLLIIIFLVYSSCYAQLFSWNKENFKQIDSKTASGNYIWLEGNGAFRFEEDTIIFLENDEVEVILNDLNGRGGMQVKLAEKASYWKYQKDVNWNYMSAGTWNVKPTKKIYRNKKYRKSTSGNAKTPNNADKTPNNADKTPKKEVNKSKQYNRYKSVKIGTQIWMSENLNTDKFRNGDPIPEAKTIEEWNKASKEGKPIWCYYDFDTKNGEKYGKLYNWNAVNDPRGLAPEGWHVSTSYDFFTLQEFLRDPSEKDFEKSNMQVGLKLQSKTGWTYGCKKCLNEKENFSCSACNGMKRNSTMPLPGIGNNQSGFSALPGGGLFFEYDSDASTEIIKFHGVGAEAHWWTTSDCQEEWETGNFRPCLFKLDNNLFSINQAVNGASVRCVKD